MKLETNIKLKQTHVAKLPFSLVSIDIPATQSLSRLSNNVTTSIKSETLICWVGKINSKNSKNYQNTHVNQQRLLPIFSSWVSTGNFAPTRLLWLKKAWGASGWEIVSIGSHDPCRLLPWQYPMLPWRVIRWFFHLIGGRPWLFEGKEDSLTKWLYNKSIQETHMKNHEFFKMM